MFPKKIMNLLLLIPLISLVGCSINKEQPQNDDNHNDKSKTSMVLTTCGDQSKTLFKEGNIKLDTKRLNNELIEVDTSETLQEIEGFGGALTHSSANLFLKDRNKKVREKLINEFFSDEGSAFNMIRVPIGASDFHSEEHFFSCCDIKGPEDDLLRNFNLDHDREIIEVIKEIYKVQPDLKIIATPWSAPWWMKIDNKTSNEDPNGYPICGGKLNPIYNYTYAEYIDTFIDEYAKEGIKINYISIINEPLINFVQYPCMQMDPPQAREIIKNLYEIIPDNVEILAYDHNAEDNMYKYLSAMMSDYHTRDNVSGIAVHGYGSQNLKEAVPQLIKRYKDKKIFMTEVTEHAGSPDFAHNLCWSASNISITPYSYGLSATVYWNLLLDENGGPCQGQYGHCYGVMNLTHDETNVLTDIVKNGAYYAMSHNSKLLKLGNDKKAFALPFSSIDTVLEGAAFKTSEDEIVISIVNRSDETKDFSIKIDDKFINTSIQNKTIKSFKI